MVLSVNQRLYDLAVAHQISLHRLSSRTTARLVRLIDACEQDVLQQLREGVTELGQARLERLLGTLRALYAVRYASVLDVLRGELADLAGYEAEYAADALRTVLPIDFEVNAPSDLQVRAANESRPFSGRYLREWGADLEQGAYDRVRDAIRIGFVEGQTVDEMVRRIRGTRSARFKDGITQVSRRGAESLVRTAVNHTANYARELTYEQNSDLVEKVRWVSTLDTRTTPICRSRDGKVYPVGSGPRPPAHWGCRSTTVPVVKSWAELGIDLPELPAGTRASMDGQVPAEETYQTWLGRQSAAVQDEALGPSRGLLFRKGGLTMDRFVDPTGRQYTLEELRRKDAAAFAAAGV